MKQDMLPELISVIMPVYNSQVFLEESIKSILNQTYKRFEFIIINDGSTDNSLEIIKKYQEQDFRVIVINRENKGIARSLNEGIFISKGKYIARMDSDDISLPQRLEKQIAFMESHTDVGVCATWIEIFGDEIATRKIGRFSKDDQVLKTSLLFSVPFPHPSVMIRTSAIKKKYKYNIKYDAIEDYKLWLDMSKTTKFSTVPEILLKYRQVHTSYSHTAEKSFEHRFKLTKKIFSEITSSLGMNNTMEEDRIHFILGLNKRISTYNLDVYKALIYINKILDSNNIKHVFDQKKLQKLLLKKILVLIYFNIQKLRLKFFRLLFNLKFWIIIFRILIR